MRNARLLAATLAILTLAACATNPVTKKREFNIVSEGQEIQIGQQSHEQIVKQFGIYNEKPELNRLVETVGRRIAATSDRPNLPWHFTVLDTPMVNAMALPGGYIYITRGMLERINSEDELAGVLGHEITHVTARHAAQQMSRAQLAQFGMVLGAVVAGPEAAQSYGQLAELGLSLLFQRYSRGQESQADLVGTQYITRASYNPVGAERMLMTLQRMDKKPTSSIERYFQSHPDPSKRVRDVHNKIAEIVTANPSATAKEPARDPYVRLVDGVMTGNSTERVVIKGNTIYDRAHGMIVEAPPGWMPTAADGMLFAMTPRNSRQQSSFIAQEVEAQELQGYDAQNAVRNRVQQMGLQYLGARQTSMTTGQQIVIDAWTGQTESGQVAVETTQFPHADHVAVFMFISPQGNTSQSPLGDIIRRSAIDPARARSVEPARIRIGTVRAREGWAELAQRATRNRFDAEAIANLNGFDVNVPPAAGMTVKLPQEIIPERP